MFEKIKHYYTIGLYKQPHLDKLLAAGAITQAEYDLIVKTKEELL